MTNVEHKEMEVITVSISRVDYKQKKDIHHGKAKETNQNEGAVIAATKEIVRSAVVSSAVNVISGGLL
jgi:hypothetical protein